MKTNCSLALSCILLTVVSCGVEYPQKEDTPEIITQVVLTFTPSSGEIVIAKATDPDGEGIQHIQVDDAIKLKAGISYNLSIELLNELANPLDPEYNITKEIDGEGEEHLFFFSWTNNLFSDPKGNGNIDSRIDHVNYLDSDENNLPIGLITSWTTVTPATSPQAGIFRVVLKHQPGIKSDSSSSIQGETDLDVSFELSIE